MAAIRTIRSFSEIPGPPTYPIIGNLYQYVIGPYSKTKYHEALRDLYKRYGPVVKQNLGGKVIVHVFEPEDIKTVYAQEGKWPVIPPLQETTQLYRAQKGMSLGLGNTNGEEWIRLRTNIQQKVLRPKEVQTHLPGVNRIAQDLVKRIERIKYITNEVNDLQTEVGKWSLENSAKIVFDKRLKAFEEGSQGEKLVEEMVRANKKIFTYSGLLKLSLPLFRYVSTPKYRALVKEEDFFYGRAIDLLDDSILRFKTATENGTLSPGEFPILSYLLSRDELTLKDVTVLSLSLFTDGLSTTTPMMLFNLYCLAVHPESQEKIFREIQSTLKDDDEYITAEHLNEMNYLRAFVKETFRLWPNGTEVSRYAESDVVVSDYLIPAGTHIDLNASVNFRNEQIFPEADSHKPERWINAQNKIHPYLLTPFGHGTRMCLGKRFAEQDLYLVLATILRNFRLEYPVGEKMDQIYHTLLFPDRPVRVKFYKRS